MSQVEPYIRVIPALFNCRFREAHSICWPLLPFCHRSQPATRCSRRRGQAGGSRAEERQCQKECARDYMKIGGARRGPIVPPPVCLNQHPYRMSNVLCLNCSVVGAMYHTFQIKIASTNTASALVKAIKRSLRHK